MDEFEIDLDDERDDEDDFGSDCDQCGRKPVVGDVGGQDLCVACFEEYQ